MSPGEMSSLLAILILSLFAQYATSLQVTPNSPCASVCVDFTDLDFSDPNSSTTGNADITCYDSEYDTSPTGQKYQKCMTCLQDSSFAQGSESDQLWFLYNLRYAFDYCIFGFPNATGVASTPCSTSFACGGLEAAFTDDKLNPKKDDYSYCTADNSAMSDSIVSQCKSCVVASDGQNYLANFLTALDTGCKQQPPTGMLIGLNDTVFSKTTITSTDPTTEKATDGKQHTLSVTQIAGIAIGAVVAVLAIAGFLFVRCRKRHNRRLLLGNTRLSMAGQKRSRHRPASSLSFRCQTHLTPRSPYFPNPSDSTIEEEKPYQVGPCSALGSHPISPRSPRQLTLPARNSNGGFNSPSRLGNKPLPLHHITTAVPTMPDTVHYSTSPKAAVFSPVDEPASTTSTKSTSQLLPLRQYNPAEYGFAPQIGSSLDGTFTSPTSGSTSSPLLSRAWEQRTPTWDLPPRVSSRSPSGGTWERVAAGVAKKNRRTSNTGSGSPVETKQINFNFPPPPTRR